MSPFARWCHRHRLAVVLAWVGLLIALGAAAGAVGSDFGTSPTSQNTDSAKATALLRKAAPGTPADACAGGRTPSRANWSGAGSGRPGAGARVLEQWSRRTYGGRPEEWGGGQAGAEAGQLCAEDGAVTGGAGGATR